MKHGANVITVLRILLSFCLLPAESFSYVFLALYTAAGLTDILDGYLARRYQISSSFGARLDTMADGIFMVIVCLKIIPFLQLSLFFIIWIWLILLIRMASLMLVRIKFHTFAILHTYANKGTGILLFLYPFMLTYSHHSEWLAVGLVLAATYSAFEEFWILLHSSELDVDAAGLYRRGGSKQE
ncbi:hypothetical protein AC622_16755 [Bacillus sp. FJAT-27916]|nr:hypothetical protein AC622_16755 [Bacillus sp. FJAT-27916]